MKKITIVTLLLSSIVALGCSNKANNGSKKDKYEFKYTTYKPGEAVDISFNFEYDLNDFDKDGTTFNKSIASLSFVQAVNAANKASIASVYNKLGFSNITYSSDFDLPEDKDTIKFTIAHKECSDYELISVTTNGVNYSKPWENNFILGTEGDAEGFVIGANKVVSDIKNYLSNYSEKVIKLWITGYSRSAAISNIAAYRLIDEGVIEEKNMFAYTFEAPRAVSDSNTKEYKSIFNILSNADLVTYVAPRAYGFKRAGIDIDLYNSKIDKWLKQIDNRWRLPTFTSDTKYSNEAEMLDYLFNTVMVKPIEQEDFHDLSTRENYVTYYQDNISYLISLIFSLKSKTMNDLADKFSNASTLELFSLLEEDGVYNFIKPVLDSNAESYDDEKLKTSTNLLMNYVKNNGDLAALAIAANPRNNLLRSLEFHYPETVLVLLMNY